MSFEPMSDADTRRVREALAKQFGESARVCLEDKVFFARGNHAWLATKECAVLLRACGRGVNVQQPGLFALTDVQRAAPSRELLGLFQSQK